MKSMTFRASLAVVVLLSVVGIVLMQRMSTHHQSLEGPIRYLPIGDSYTIGEGVLPEAAWPSVLTAHVKRDGVDITLIGNPARTGWTTQDALENELPLFEKERPNFSTLLIGVNDWVQKVDDATFRRNLQHLLDRMLAVLPDPSRLVVVTIPDFSVTPLGSEFFGGRAAAGIAQFNSIIQEEAASRSLKVVDIYPISQQMGTDNTLVAADRLHPSAAEHSIWEELIYPVVRDSLRQATSS